MQVCGMPEFSRVIAFMLCIRAGLKSDSEPRRRRSVELIGSEPVAVRLPYLPFLPHAPFVTYCKYKSTHARRATLPFGQQHAISQCVRANTKPTGREFERQIQSGFHCKEPLGGCHEMQFDR
jgi:hypothetical protein